MWVVNQDVRLAPHCVSLLKVEIAWLGHSRVAVHTVLSSTSGCGGVQQQVLTHGGSRPGATIKENT